MLDIKVHYLPPLPPRCPHPDYMRGCPDCQSYNRARLEREAKARASGRWQPRVDGDEVVQHINKLRAAGMSKNRIAKEARVSYSSINRSMHGRQRQFATDIAKRILAVKPRGDEVPTLTGITRRLQAMAAMGFGLKHVSELVGVSTHKLGRIRSSLTSSISMQAHSAIIEAYDAMLATDPYESQSRMAVDSTKGYAKERGWLPPEAWTESTVDDPRAQPYSGVEPFTYVDYTKVAFARLPKDSPQRVPFTELSFAEQLELVRGYRGSLKQFQDTYRPAPISVLRRLFAVVQSEREMEQASASAAA